MVLEGRRLVEDALASGAHLVGVVIDESSEAAAPLARRAAADGIQVERLALKEFAELAATEHPSGVLAVAEWEPREVARLEPPSDEAVVLVLDAIQDPGNVGTMLRTALALGAWGVIALDGTADVRAPKVLRAAMGAHFRLPVAEGSLDDAVAWCARHQVAVLVSDAGARQRPARFAPRTALVVGNEGQGVRDAWSRHEVRRVGLPMAKGAESLNAAMAAGIMLYELLRPAG